MVYTAEPAPGRRTCTRIVADSGTVDHIGSLQREIVECQIIKNMNEISDVGGECRDRTCATFRSRRVSTAMPCRSANSPEPSAGFEPAQARGRNPALCPLSYEGSLLLHDLFRPAFARRSTKPNQRTIAGLRAGGKPVPTFRIMH